MIEYESYVECCKQSLKKYSFLVFHVFWDAGRHAMLTAILTLRVHPYATEAANAWYPYFQFQIAPSNKDKHFFFEFSRGNPPQNKKYAPLRGRGYKQVSNAAKSNNPR